MGDLQLGVPPGVLKSQGGETLTFGNCSFPGLEAENRLPFCSRKSKPGKRGKEERRGLCAQQLKFDKVCSNHKPE